MFIEGNSICVKCTTINQQSEYVAIFGDHNQRGTFKSLQYLKRICSNKPFIL